MKIGMTLLFAALVATGGACKKKDKGSTETTDPGSGTPKPAEGSGSATAAKPETPPPAEKPLEGEALAKKYIACVGMISDSKFDEFQKDCVADDFKVHMAGMPDAEDATASKTYLKNMKAGFPDWKLSPQLVMVNGRTILAVEHADRRLAVADGQGDPEDRQEVRRADVPQAHDQRRQQGDRGVGVRGSDHDDVAARPGSQGGRPASRSARYCD